jgi:hypothetical protein
MSGARSAGETGALRRAAQRGVALAAALTCVCACSAASDPSRVEYNVTFPSTAAAVAADGLEIHVFDAAEADLAGDVCASLVVRRRSDQDLPAALVARTDLTPCALHAGQGTLSVSYGSRAFLVVAQRARQDFLIGCAYVDLSATTAPVEIPLALFATTIAVPATTCASLSDHCAGGC